MEIGESASPAIIASNNHDADCPFCNAKTTPDKTTNDFDDEGEDANLDGGYGKFKNDAAKLGKALGASGEKEVEVRGKSRPSTAAAHHLIPGNAALKKSKLFTSNKYLWKDGSAKGNIGYNVNAAENGVWLPGNYAVRPWSGLDPIFQNRYAFGAMKEWRRQFHDAHGVYSNFVRQCLDQIFSKLKLGSTVWCEKGKADKDKSPEERDPLYAIVGRLNTISGRMRNMLVAPTTNWKKNIYTSSRALTFMVEAPHL